MDGILPLDKPTGLTSAKALYRVRKLTGIRKSGHAGTLDPGATGVLLICQGRATKLVEQLMDLPKTYVTTARLDVTSQSFDSDEPLQPVEIAERPTREQVEAALSTFVGTIMQVPPAISAIKINGVPAYRRARRGEIVEIKARPARIDAIRVISFDWPVLSFVMRCGRGTYVRSIIRDLGERLSTGGCLTALRRTRIGPFHTMDANDADGGDVARDEHSVPAVGFEALESAEDPNALVTVLDVARAMLSPADQPTD